MKIVDRVTLVHAGLLVFMLALLGRAAKVQLIDGSDWAARAQRQHFSPSALPAVRGPILDAAGTTLVESRERTRLSVAPHEVRDLEGLIRGLIRAGVPRRVVARLRRDRRRWVDIPGTFPPADIAPLVALRGVYAQPVVDRVYAQSAGIRRIVGRLDPGGQPLDGIELVLDSLLRGDSARLGLPRDREGRLMPGLAWSSALPHPGATVTMTISRSLQEICDRALAIAVDTLRASGGDIVVLNPHTGDVLAMASRRADPEAVANTAISEPFEPGSTLKPFYAAALLARRRARVDEIVSTHNGVYALEGRTIRDVHKASALSLADVIRYSSNIGMVQFAARLTAGEKYELLRDLGFGTQTGIPLPAEATGTLRPPKAWSRQTAASLVMGYEIAVTPLQLALAYAAFANGGVLMEPQFLKEIRDAEGNVLFRARRRAVRRVFAPDAANMVRAMLLGVVESGTAIKADLANYRVGGKSGTARRVEVGRGYAPGRYTASFVGLFPGEDPQYVVLVKLDDPRGVIYGGETAAPVTRVVLEAALAARDAALDRDALADADRKTVDSFATAQRVREQIVERAPPSETASTSTAVAGWAVPAPRDTVVVGGEAPSIQHVERRVSVPRVFDLPVAAPPKRRITLAARAVPDVTTLPLRAAVRALHEAGFRVVLAQGPSTQARPAPGTVLPAGAIVRLTVAQ